LISALSIWHWSWRQLSGLGLGRLALFNVSASEWV